MTWPEVGFRLGVGNPPSGPWWALPCRRSIRSFGVTEVRCCDLVCEDMVHEKGYGVRPARDDGLQVQLSAKDAEAPVWAESKAEQWFR